jgi:hypothetical protein
MPKKKSPNSVRLRKSTAEFLTFAYKTCVTAVEKLKTAQRAALAELDALFASLQHRAFHGEL